ncbi:MAG: heme exporter protein CcmB, partial [Candidatus Puniceispirillum sp.]
MHSFRAHIKRDLKIAWRNRQDIAVMLIFFVIIIALFPLAFGPSA